MVSVKDILSNFLIFFELILNYPYFECEVLTRVIVDGYKIDS